jgi:hypothetical protein
MTEASEAVNAATSGAGGAAFVGDAGPQARPQELPPESDHQRYRQLRDKLQTELNQRVENVSNDEELDSHAKDWKLGALWDSAVSADAKLSEFYERELQDQVGEAERKVYRVPSHLQDSTRSSYQLVESEMDLAGLEGEDSHAKLEKTYSRAVRTGDKALQTACFHRSVELGIDWLRDKHLETSNELRQAFSDYTAAQRKLADWTDKEQNLVQRLQGLRGLVQPIEIK